MGAAQVSYNGNRIIPAPFVNITKDYQRTKKDDKVGSEFKLTLNGKIIAWKGSPSSSGTFWNQPGTPPDESYSSGVLFDNIIRKQEALRLLFATDGLSLEFQPCDGATAMKCNPIFDEIVFPEGLWVQQCDYTINCRANYIMGLITSGTGEDNFPEYISNAVETWQLEFNDEPESVSRQHSFKLTHNLSAEGKLNYDVNGVPNEPWKEAQAFVLPKLGIDTNFLQASGSLNLGSELQGYNYLRGVTTDVMGGTYSVSENWILSSGSAFEDFTCSVKSGITDGLVDVTLEGTIKGLEINSYGTNPGDFTTTQTKYVSASGLWNTVKTNLFSRAQVYSNSASFSRALNPTPVNTVVGQNPVGGVINYSYEFNTRASTSIAGALSETWNIADNDANDIFAKLFVLGRQKGPVLQSLGTVTENTRTINVEVVTLPAAGKITNAASVETLYNNYSPASAVDTIMQAFRQDLENSYSQVFVSQDQSNWQPFAGRFTRTYALTYQGC